MCLFPRARALARTRVRTCVCVCVRARAHLSVATRAPTSISAKLKFCIVCVYIDYEATAARSSVSCVKYDYSYRDLSEDVV